MATYNSYIALMRRNKDSMEALSPLSMRNRNTNEATPSRGCFVMYKEL